MLMLTVVNLAEKMDSERVNEEHLFQNDVINFFKMYVPTIQPISGESESLWMKLEIYIIYKPSSWFHGHSIL